MRSARCTMVWRMGPFGPCLKPACTSPRTLRWWASTIRTPVPISNRRLRLCASRCGNLAWRLSGCCSAGWTSRGWRSPGSALCWSQRSSCGSRVAPLSPAEHWPRPRRHSQKLLGAFVEDRVRNLQGLVQGILALLNPLGERPRQLPPHQTRLGVSPFHAISVREEPHLLVRGEHVQTLANDLPDDVGEEIVPPVAGQGEIRQFSRQGAQRLVGMAAGQETLEPEFGMASDDLAQLPDDLL